jgi:hypothetical protein
MWFDAARATGTQGILLTQHCQERAASVSSTTAMVRLHGRAHRAIQATLAVFFGCAGVKLLLASR